MTKLNKRIDREVGPFGGLSHGRPVVMSLLPGGTLEFREKGTRTAYRVHLESCFVLAAQMAAERLREDRSNRKVLRRATR